MNISGVEKMRYTFCLFAMIISACNAVPSPPAPRSGTSVQASFGKTWDATIDQFAERNIQIKTLDRASGLIVAEPQHVAEGQTDLADCGKFFGVALNPTDATWNVLVRGDSTRASVKATVRFVHVGEAGSVLATRTKSDVLECSSKGTWETSLETTIKERAEAKK
jgi:hypothetical protein